MNVRDAGGHTFLLGGAKTKTKKKKKKEDFVTRSVSCVMKITKVSK